MGEEEAVRAGQSSPLQVALQERGCTTLEEWTARKQCIQALLWSLGERISEAVAQNPSQSPYRRSLCCGEAWMAGHVPTPEWMGEYENYFAWRQIPDDAPVSEARERGWKFRAAAAFVETRRRGISGEGDEFRKVLGYRDIAKSQEAFWMGGLLTEAAAKRYVAWLRAGNAPVWVPLSVNERVFLAAEEKYQREEEERQRQEAERQREIETWRAKPDPASENQKRGRGRPRQVFGPEGWDDELQALGVLDGLTTERGRQDARYRQRAIHILGSDYPWLYDPEQVAQGGAEGKKGWKPSILAELGRIDDAERMRVVARQVCREKPKAKQATAYIRRCRVGISLGSEEQLRKEVIAAIDGYRQRHPRFSFDEVLDVLDEVREAVETAAAR